MSVPRAERIARVEKALRLAGVTSEIRRLAANTATAVDAAAALGCEVNTIAKSLVFRSVADDSAVLTVLSGGRRVSLPKLAVVVGAEVKKADATFVREKTGFEIGGVPPIAHNDSLRIFMDEQIRQYDIVWAAAGSVYAVFPIAPEVLATVSKAQFADISE